MTLILDGVVSYDTPSSICVEDHLTLSSEEAVSCVGAVNYWVVPAHKIYPKFAGFSERFLINPSKGFLNRNFFDKFYECGKIYYMFR